MKNTFFLLMLLSFTNAALAQVSTVISWTEKTKLDPKNTIYYNATKKLVWDDFKGTASQPEPIAAITASGFGYKSAMHTVNGKGEITVSIYCYFNKQNSWVRKGKNTAYILNHEQHHFDVTYIAAKMFIDKVKAAGLTTSNMETLLSKIYKECTTAMHKMQNDYDKETNNGQIKEKQEEWNKFIELQLKA
jgi:hypothetical protein